MGGEGEGEGEKTVKDKRKNDRKRKKHKKAHDTSAKAGKTPTTLPSSDLESV